MNEVLKAQAKMSLFQYFSYRQVALSLWSSLPPILNISGDRLHVFVGEEVSSLDWVGEKERVNKGKSTSVESEVRGAKSKLSEIPPFSYASVKSAKQDGGMGSVG